MHKWFEKYFAFSRRELNGICVLGVCLLFLWAIPRFYRMMDTSKAEDLSTHIDQIEHFLSTAAPRGELARRDSRAVFDVPPHMESVEYFTFDPNGLAVVDWKRLGLSDRQIRVIKNYEAKGGRFHVKEDLKKIYSIGAQDYARLAPYIHIPAVKSKQNNTPREQESAPQVVTVREKDPASLSLELNTADSLSLQQLPGIGPVYASRIIRFRNLLGGFHSTSQLMDVYGFDTVRFNGLKAYVYVDSSAVQKIALNTADYDQLRAHPFISAKLANLMVQYRRQHGPYRALGDLLHIAVMDDEIFRKIAPYLTIYDD